MGVVFVIAISKRVRLECTGQFVWTWSRYPNLMTPGGSDFRGLRGGVSTLKLSTRPTWPVLWRSSGRLCGTRWNSSPPAGGAPPERELFVFRRTAARAPRRIHRHAIALTIARSIRITYVQLYGYGVGSRPRDHRVECQTRSVGIRQPQNCKVTLWHRGRSADARAAAREMVRRVVTLRGLSVTDHWSVGMASIGPSVSKSSSWYSPSGTRNSSSTALARCPEHWVAHGARRRRG
jgi:hypothetical protein